MRIGDVIDKKDLSARVDGDIEFVKELIDVFLEDYPKLLSDLKDAVEKRNAQLLNKYAHTLKGSVGNFAAKGAFDMASKLETMGQDSDFSNVDESYKSLEVEIEQLKQAMELLKNEVSL